jgi:hypothetical protein
MSSIVIAGDTSGTCTLQANAVAGTTTLTLPTTSGTLYAKAGGGAIGVADGGTGATTLTANNVILGNGTSAVQFVAPGTTGNVLTSNGTTWTSAAAAAFDAGTRLIFAQSTAPTGWTKDTTNYNNHALRVVTGAASTGGTVDFTTAFASQAVSGTVGTSGATTLSTSEIPSHTHSYQRASGSASGIAGGCGVNNEGATTGATGGGGSHTHSGGTFTGTAINLAVKYLDVITATKN